MTKTDTYTQSTTQPLPHVIDVDRLIKDISQAKAIIYMVMLNLEPGVTSHYNDEIAHDALDAAAYLLLDGRQVCEEAVQLKQEKAYE